MGFAESRGKAGDRAGDRTEGSARPALSRSPAGRRSLVAPPTPGTSSRSTYLKPPWSGTGEEGAAPLPSHHRRNSDSPHSGHFLDPGRVLHWAPPPAQPPGRAPGSDGGPRRPLQSRARGSFKTALPRPAMHPPPGKYAAGVSCHWREIPADSNHTFHGWQSKQRYSEESLCLMVIQKLLIVSHKKLRAIVVEENKQDLIHVHP